VSDHYDRGILSHLEATGSPVPRSVPLGCSRSSHCGFPALGPLPPTSRRATDAVPLPVLQLPFLQRNDDLSVVAV